MDIKRIFLGNSKYPSINSDTISQLPIAGVFTFDNTEVTFDSIIDTFDFDIIEVPVVVARQYSDEYSLIDYK